jgi:hypothetical protein
MWNEHNLMINKSVLDQRTIEMLRESWTPCNSIPDFAARNSSALDHQTSKIVNNPKYYNSCDITRSTNSAILDIWNRDILPVVVMSPKKYYRTFESRQSNSKQEPQWFSHTPLPNSAQEDEQQTIIDEAENNYFQVSSGQTYRLFGGGMSNGQSSWFLVISIWFSYNMNWTDKSHFLVNLSLVKAHAQTIASSSFVTIRRMLNVRQSDGSEICCAVSQP